MHVPDFVVDPAPAKQSGAGDKEQRAAIPNDVVREKIQIYGEREKLQRPERRMMLELEIKKPPTARDKRANRGIHETCK